MKRIQQSASLILCLVLFLSPLSAQSTLRLSLADAEAHALKESPRYQAAAHLLESARKRRDAARGQLWPKLSVEGSYRYVTEVPELALSPSAPKRKFGDNENYSVGPQLSWTAWDSGAIYQQWKSLDVGALAKEEDLRWARRQVLLETRLAYFQTMVALEQARLLSDSLKLAQSQYADIENRRRGGISTRIDSLSAHQEVLGRQRQFRQAQTDLALALRELFNLTGQGQDADVSLPADARAQDNLPSETPPPSLFLQTEPLPEISARLEPAARREVDANDPRVAALLNAVRSFELSAKSASAGHLPKIQFFAKTSLDHPNGPIIETFNQNAVGVSASLPLFEGGRVVSLTADLKEQARAAEESKRGAQKDLMRDWRKAQDQLAGLRAQREINAKSVQETEELARLIYNSYKSGASNYIDVQTANVRALEAKVQSARTEAQILMQLAILSALTGDQ